MAPFPEPGSLLPAYECWMAGNYYLPATLCLWPNAKRAAISDKEIKELADRFHALDFDPALIQRLGATGLFEESFLNYLQRFRPDCRIEKPAITGPLASISGPLIQVRLLKPLAMEMIEGDWKEENNNPHALHL